jgi:DNA polymerase V
LAACDLKVLRRQYSVNLERTARELNGERCFALEEGAAPKKMIACTRSFGQRKYSLAELQEAVTGYTTRAAEKLRGQRQLCQAVQVFVQTSPFDRSGERYGRSTGVQLMCPTADTRDLVAAAQAGLQTIYRLGPAYAKAGIVLADFVEPGRYTPDLFAPPARPGADRLMAVVDSINARQGRGTVRPARISAEQGFSMRREFLSPQFTTSWADLLRVRC